MNTDTITRWLQNPAGLPEESAVQSLLQAHPWFVPARLMEAAHQHRRSPYAPGSLSLLQLYGSDWVPVYRLLSAVNPAAEAVIVDLKVITAGESSQSAHVDIPLIKPPYTEDYFRHQRVEVVNPEKDTPTKTPERTENPKTLMVVMSFAEWLSHFKVKSEREEEEIRDKRALRSMWQQEKLAAALEDEPEEIPEDVFEMAVSSITREDDLASESLAEILEKQQKWSAAAEMYRKLGLRNPAKSAYFASRAEAAKKRAS